MSSSKKRVLPHVVVRHPSPNHSHRSGPISLIIIHATAGHNRKGVTDLTGLGNWFDNPHIPANQKVSSHVATDNEANSARYVADALKAWHVAAYNSMALGCEQVIPGDGTEITENLYRETARWIAYWSILHHLPIRLAEFSHGGSVLKSGVARHSSLGALGGGHADPGRYNLHHAMSLARYYAPKQRRLLGL
jgi:hypothetical protein